MMTSTASIQVNLDAGPRDGWAERVRLAHALGPTMIAIAANSPLLAGRFTGWVSTRQRVWSQLDSARCGPILGASGDDPCTDWARYALKAPVMLVHTPDAVAVTEHVPFADWADGLVLLGDRRPTTADLDYHLTTLFPPVRPRRWLEIRYLDSVPDDAVAGGGVPAGHAARRSGCRRGWPPRPSNRSRRRGISPPGSAWPTSGSTRPPTAAWPLAAERAPAELSESMQRLVQNVENGRCPADDFADQRHPAAASRAPCCRWPGTTL